MAFVKIDYENNAETWWDSARERTDIPAELRELLQTEHGCDCVRFPDERLPEIVAWCESIPGWADGPEYAREALIIASEERE